MVRDRLDAYLRGAARAQRSERAARHAELVAARPHEGGWELVVVRHGRLAATATTPGGVDPRPVIASLLATAEHVEPPCPPASGAHPEETELVLGWLEEPGVRLVEVAEGWACPVRGAESLRAPGAVAAAIDLTGARLAAELWAATRDPDPDHDAGGPEGADRPVDAA